MRLAIGTYTDGGVFVPDVRGEGIMFCSFDLDTGRFSDLHCVATVPNPSWIHLTDEGRSLFAVSEMFDVPGQVHGFAVSPDGVLTQTSSLSSEGLATCHLGIGPETLYAASYLDGVLSVYSREGAELTACVAKHHFDGSGPCVERQESAHAHQAELSPDGRWLYVCDLGADRVRQFALENGLPVPIRELVLPPGTGPRHLVFHPEWPVAWLVGELDAGVTVLYVEPETGILQAGEMIRFSELPELSGAGATAAVHLHPSGRLLGVSERESHGVLLFDLDAEGKPTFRQKVAEAGRVPRDFLFSPDGRWLLIAYQGTHQLASFALSEEGTAENDPTDLLSVGSPVCLAMF